MSLSLLDIYKPSSDGASDLKKSVLNIKINEKVVGPILSKSYCISAIGTVNKALRNFICYYNMKDNL